MTPPRRVARGAAVVLAVAVLVLGLRTWVVETRAVESTSMGATLRPGRLVVLDKLRPVLAGVRPGDVVVLTSPSGEEVVKRVVATGGQEVEITGAALRVDGALAREPQVDAEAMDGVLLGPLVVPDGDVYVLGDDRGRSVDSRDFGPVPVGSVRGTVVWPPTGAWSLDVDAGA